MSEEDAVETDGSEIAIVGMALRVPGANDIDQYWSNLRDGVESVRRLSEDDLREAGVSEAELRHPRYVPVTAPLDGAKDFDAALFGFSPRDAAVMDPQHRHFIEVSWEALEHAGYDPAQYDGPIGVFGGSGHNVYMSYNLMTNPELMDSVGFFLVRHTSNDKDFLVTRVSYLFDLTGPAINVQTACSTSLVAVHMGVQSLLNGESDMALAGGVTIDMPLNHGYVYKEGEILARDGHCRAFDAESSGTVFGSGAGVVVLKRLDDAIEAGDTVHAVIRGSAINNDGSNKVGYLAPSVDGQAAAVGEAIALADINPESIGFIECHGTGTQIGDPIEVAALTQAFRAHTELSDFCALGSVKTNIGHLDTAAGIAGLIKATLALKNKVIPPTVHFEKPNPRIDFDGSPFFVNGELLDWPEGPEPRRAGVSSLGVGGTNAHILLEEAPIVEQSNPSSRSWQLLPISAKGPNALDEATTNLGEFFERQPDANLADVAYTLQKGRQALDKRRFVVVDSAADAAKVLGGSEPRRIVNGTAEVKDRSVVFMFPGQGAQYADMGRGLYDSEPIFRDCVDECSAILEPHIGFDLRTLLYPTATSLEDANEQLAQTSTTQPAIFTIEYAMAKLLMSWGIQPTAMIGHSIGEYTAACLSEVFSLPDALKIVAKRGQLMQELPTGSMLAIPKPAGQVEQYLLEGLSLAALNGPEFSVVAGPHNAIDALQSKLEGQEIAVRRLHTSHAFHSSMMDPMLDDFVKAVADTKRGEPRIPFVSNVTGRWITANQIADPNHWAAHVRSAVDFVGGLGAILENYPEPALVEVGPGRTLSTFAKQLNGPHRNTISTSMRHATADGDDQATVLSTIGELWAAGAISDWSAFHSEEQRRRIPLPTYPFQHQEYWVDPGEHGFRQGSIAGLEKKPDIADWFYIPAWNQTPPPAPTSEAVSTWLVFVDQTRDGGVGVEVADMLGQDSNVITVAPGATYDYSPPHVVINAEDPTHYTRMLQQLANDESVPEGIAYLWPLAEHQSMDVGTDEFEWTKVANFHGQVFLAQALADEGLSDPIDWWVVTNQMHSVAGESDLNALQALTNGPAKVIGQEYPHIRIRTLDLSSTSDSGRSRRASIVAIADELKARAEDDVVAHRGQTRWVQDHVATPLAESVADDCVITDGGVYLITGGTAGIGLKIAEHLASSASAKLVLLSRTALPEPEDRQHWLETHGELDPTSRKIRRLLAMEAAGAQTMVVGADVTNLEQMTAVVAQAIERFGTIDGVFHAAGHLADQLISMKERDEAESVLAAKVTGTLVLEKALVGVDLDFLALFSSVSAIAGTAGQVDYAAANGFLNAYAQSRSTLHDGLTVAIGWGPWQEVGMTVRTAIGLGLMDDADALVPVEHSLLDRWYRDGDEDIFEVELSSESHWLLDEHRALGGVAILPGTGYLDIVTAAFYQRDEAEPYEVADLFFMAPFMVTDGDRATLRITLDRKDGDFIISSSVGGSPQEHARGQIRPLEGGAPSALDMTAIEAACLDRVVEHERFENPKLLWGPRWNNLRRVGYGSDEAFATLEIPEKYLSDLVDHRLHPALLDLATGGAQDLIVGFDPASDFFVPFSYGRLRHHRPLCQQMYSHIRYRQGEDSETAVFDVSLVDPAGEILVDVEGFVMRRAVGEIAAVVTTESVTGVTEPILQSIENGIATHEGMQALRRVLSGRGVPEITVVSQDLHALIRRSAEARESSGGGEGGTGIAHQRPDVSTPFVAPSTVRETAIATVWEEMLGLAGIGIHDDFFELGGHSLLLTQAITRIKKLTTADVSLFTLFEASTIAELVSEMEEAEAEEAESGRVAAPKLGRVSRDDYRTQVTTLQNQGRDNQGKEERR